MLREFQNRIDALPLRRGWGTNPDQKVGTTLGELIRLLKYYDTPCTPAQAKGAWRMAQAFGHGWSVVNSWDLDNVRTLFDIFELAIRAGVDTMGLCCPAILDSGIGDRTATGRFQWIVDSDGTIHLEMRRPDCCLAELEIPFNGNLEPELSIGYIDEWRPRHVGAFGDLLVKLLVIPEEVHEILSCMERNSVVSVEIHNGKVSPIGDMYYPQDGGYRFDFEGILTGGPIAAAAEELRYSKCEVAEEIRETELEARKERNENK